VEFFVPKVEWCLYQLWVWFGDRRLDAVHIVT
jgi:hypothetical protein